MVGFLKSYQLGQRHADCVCCSGHNMDSECSYAGQLPVLQATKEADVIARKNASQKPVAYANDPAIVQHKAREKLSCGSRE